MKKSLLILVFALIGNAILFAQNTIYVNSVTGDDTTGDGTSGTPYKTFHMGYTMAAGGDVLDLTGTFDWTDTDETGDVATNGYILSKNLTIQGQGASSTIIQAATTANSTDRRIFTINSSYTISIKDLALRHGNLISNGSGGAIRIGSITTDVTIDACILESNNASTASYTYSFGGGAIFCYNSNASGGQLIIKNSIIRNNTSTNCWGGAIYHYRGTSGASTVVVENTTISGNSAANGTAMAGYYGAYIITNSTITDNSATTTVIMSNHSYGLFYMTNVTFAYNSLGASGRGLYLESVSDIRIKNSIIAQNKRSDNSVNDYYRTGGVLNSSTNNIIEAQGISDFTNGVDGNIIGVQDFLNLSNTLDINDSSGISSTLALSTNSVAINAGDNVANGSVIVPTADQRGVDRVGLVDIGAYEFDGTLNTAPEINSSASVNFEENSIGTVIDVESSDTEGDTEGSGLTYAFSTETGGGIDNALFSIDTNTGIITFLASPDFETPGDDDTNNDYEVQVTVTDSGGLTAVQDITITVTDQASEPIIDSIVDFDATSGRHNLTSGTRLYYIPFKTPACTSYDLAELGANIEATSAAGNVKLGLYSNDRSTLLYETSTVAVTGGVDEYVSAAISPGTLTLEKNTFYWVGIIGDAEIWIDADENPINNGTATDLATGTYAMYQTDSVTYPDFPEPATIEIVWYRAVSLVVKGIQAPSTIDTSVTLSDATVTANNESASYQWIDCSDMSIIDGETSRSYTATVSGDYAVIVTEGGCSSTSNCTAVVVNNAPVITSSSTVDFAENAAGTVVDVESTDTEGDTEGSGLTYAFSTETGGGIDNALFSIDTNTGVITFLVSPVYETPEDDDTDNDYEVQVTVTDSGSSTAVQDITISVTDATAPTVVSQNATVQLDANGNVTVVESDIITSMSDNGTLNPTVVLSGTDFTCADVGTVAEWEYKSSSLIASYTGTSYYSDATGIYAVGVNDNDDSIQLMRWNVTDWQVLSTSSITMPVAYSNFSRHSNGEFIINIIDWDYKFNILKYDSNTTTWSELVSSTVNSQFNLSSTYDPAGFATNPITGDIWMSLVPSSSPGGTYTPNVLKYDGTNISLVGYPRNGITTEWMNNCDITFTSDGNATVIFGARNNPLSPFVVSYDGTDWTNRGVINGIQGRTYFNSIITSSTNEVYIAFRDATSGLTHLLKTSDFVTWDSLVSTSASPSAISLSKLSNGNIYFRYDTVGIFTDGNTVTDFTGTTGVSLHNSEMIENPEGGYLLCGSSPHFQSNSRMYSYNPGNVTSYVVTDEAGNETTGSVEITIEDNLSPTIVTQDITVQLDGTGNVSITTSDINDGSSDNCSIDTMELSKYDFTTTDIGVNTVNLTITDVNGNVDSASAEVTVETSLSVEDEIENSFKIYPNPVKNMLTISAQVEIEQISLFNLIGQKVLELEVNSNSATVDMSRLTEGIYNAVIKTNNASSTSKIIKK